MCSCRFQLEHCGHLLPRDPGTKDYRTSSFDPDPWQQKVLDVIDQGASALVCAPTSSGKTFISNYVICKVLAESSNGIVVFVAPTKALVNQVQAQVSVLILLFCSTVSTSCLLRSLQKKTAIKFI